LVVICTCTGPHRVGATEPLKVSLFDAAEEDGDGLLGGDGLGGDGLGELLLGWLVLAVVGGVAVELVEVW